MRGLDSIDDETLKALISNHQGYHNIFINSVDLTDEQLKVFDSKPKRTSIYFKDWSKKR